MSDPIGRRIADEREALGMTQTLLAQLAGIDRDKLNKMEHGRRQVTVEEGARIARALGFTIDQLLNGGALVSRAVAVLHDSAPAARDIEQRIRADERERIAKETT